LLLAAASGLDPTWEETFEFDVADENTTKCFVKFMMGAEGEEKQIGDECKCWLVWREGWAQRGEGSRSVTSVSSDGCWLCV
jgi:hypothetical protein